MKPLFLIPSLGSHAANISQLGNVHKVTTQNMLSRTIAPRSLQKA